MSSSPKFDEKETAILFALYDVPNGTHTSYTLAQRLNPTIPLGTPPFGAAFAETRGATEQLIARGLVSGERLTATNNGVYFNKLKLTAKGQRAAIQQRELIQKQKSIKAVSEFLQGKPETEIDAPKQVAEFLEIEHKDKM
jgi:hypothetical protein